MPLSLAHTVTIGLSLAIASLLVLFPTWGCAVSVLSAALLVDLISMSGSK